MPRLSRIDATNVSAPTVPRSRVVRSVCRGGGCVSPTGHLPGGHHRAGERSALPLAGRATVHVNPGALSVARKVLDTTADPAPGIVGPYTPHVQHLGRRQRSQCGCHGSTGGHRSGLDTVATVRPGQGNARGLDQGAALAGPKARPDCRRQREDHRGAHASPPCWRPIRHAENTMSRKFTWITAAAGLTAAASQDSANLCAHPAQPSARTARTLKREATVQQSNQLPPGSPSPHLARRGTQSGVRPHYL